MLRIRGFIGRECVFWYWCQVVPRVGDYIERVHFDAGTSKRDRRWFLVKRVIHVVQEELNGCERTDTIHLFGKLVLENPEAA